MFSCIQFHALLFLQKETILGFSFVSIVNVISKVSECHLRCKFFSWSVIFLEPKLINVIFLTSNILHSISSLLAMSFILRKFYCSQSNPNSPSNFKCYLNGCFIGLFPTNLLYFEYLAFNILASSNIFHSKKVFIVHNPIQIHPVTLTFFKWLSHSVVSHSSSVLNVFFGIGDLLNTAKLPVKLQMSVPPVEN